MRRFIFSVFILVSLVAATYLFKTHLDNLALRKKGIYYYNPVKTSPGFNLYHARRDNNVFLIQNDGEVVNKWHLGSVGKEGIHHAELDQIGNLYAIIQIRRLEKIDKDSNVIWSSKFNVHHDLDYDQSGLIITFDLKERNIEAFNQNFKVYADNLVFINPLNGEIVRSVDLLEVLRPVLDKRALLQAAVYYKENNKISDFLHLNSIQFIKEDHPGLCPKGSILISARNLSQIFILDPSISKVLWQGGVEHLDNQHEPILLKNGNILVFDNGRETRDFSRVIEFRTDTKEIVWEYKSKPAQKMYSYRHGGVQRLPNGNTLIAVANQGLVFEVAMNREIIWKFQNPLLEPDSNEPANLYRMHRYTKEFFRNFPFKIATTP
ncbi:MAG: aryl-sulfate sulfotransferase [Deltaproteobacteria bacterium]|nr:aryl-sulfate sulfotransferase [Deltaproteobacteria bacterium]